MSGRDTEATAGPSAIKLEPADFEKWTTRALWSLTQTCFLLLGYEPNKVHRQDAHNGFMRIPDASERESFEDVYERLKDEYKLHNMVPVDKGPGLVWVLEKPASGIRPGSQPHRARYSRKVIVIARPKRRFSPTGARANWSRDLSAQCAR